MAYNPFTFPYGQFPTQYPTAQQPTQYPGMYPGQYPSQYPGQYPGQFTGQYGQYPMTTYPSYYPGAYPSGGTQYGQMPQAFPQAGQMGMPPSVTGVTGSR